jgi:signal peptidase I
MNGSDRTELDAAARARAAELRTSRKLATWLVGPLAALLIGLILVFFVFFDSSTVIGTSMLPTLRDHDYVLLTKGLATPRRGDIVVLNVVYQGNREEWVKRIVALGGDHVDVRGDIILVNGLPEQFKHLIRTNGSTSPIESLTVPRGELFVAGDNRPVSEDSRIVGPFPVASIKGRVLFIYAPLWRIGPIPAPGG